MIIGPTRNERLDAFITHIEGLASRAYGAVLGAAIITLGLDWLIRDPSLGGLAVRAIAATLVVALVMRLRLRLIDRLLARYYQLRELEATHLRLVAKTVPSIADTI